MGKSRSTHNKWSSDGGYHWHECTADGCPVTDNSQKEGYAAHTYDQQVVSDTYLASAANCTDPAKYYYSCVCGAKGTETFENGDALGHSWGSWQSNGDDTHTRTCSVCGDTESQNCSGGEATCTALAVCETCGNSYGAINPENHIGEIVWTRTATTHSSAYSCCNTPVVAEEAHKWQNGVCSECGYEKAAVEIPATGITEDPSEPPTDTNKPSGDQTDNTTSPETGDDSNIALWIAVLLAAGAVLTGTAVYSRKRKCSR